MKIKTTILTITIIALSYATGHANPLEYLIRDVAGVVGITTGRQPICTTYYEEGRQRYNSFNRPVTFFDGYEYTKGTPPPDAYVYVRYPGRAPKYLYQDKSIQVQCHGDSHTIVYRKPGW